MHETHRLLIAKYIVELVRSVLEERSPKKRPDGISMAEIFRIVQKQRMECITYDAVRQVTEKEDEQVLLQWYRSSRICAAQSKMQKREEQAILSELIQSGVRNMPLKGCIMKKLYPREEYRQMSDLDLLIDVNNRKTVQTILENLGYCFESRECEDTVDVYRKEPWMCVEVHNSLLSGHHKNYSKYTDIWERSVEKNGVYQMSWDDYYIFMIEHFAKHFYISGCGIRFLLDVYIFLEKKGTDLHPEYLKEQFRVRNLEDFRQKMEKLAYQWFGKEGRIGDTEEECTILLSGVFGNLQNYYRNMQKEIYQKYKIAWLVKPIYIWKRIFVPYYEMCEKYPVLEKWPVLLPAAWMFRLFRTLLTQRKRFFREYQTIRGEK